jgi:hypothetical protein
MEYWRHAHRRVTLSTQLCVNEIYELSPSADEVIDPRELSEGNCGLQLTDPMVVPKLEVTASRRIKILLRRWHSEPEAWYTAI